MKKGFVIIASMVVLSACAMLRHHTPQLKQQPFKYTVPLGMSFYQPQIIEPKAAKRRNMDSLISSYYKVNFDRFFKSKFDSINYLLLSVPGILSAQRAHADSVNSANVELTKLNYKSALQQAILTKIAVDAVASKQDAMAENIKSINEVDLLLKRLYSMEIMPYLIIAFFILLFIASTPDLLKAIFAYFKRKHLEVEIKKLHNAK
jgi:hypothetical protein